METQKAFCRQKGRLLIDWNYYILFFIFNADSC
jgi:hypothetical protein